MLDNMNIELLVSILLGILFGGILGYLFIIYESPSCGEPEVIREPCECPPVIKTITRIIPEKFSYDFIIKCKDREDIKTIREYKGYISIDRRVYEHDSEFDNHNNPTKTYVGHNKITVRIDDGFDNEYWDFCSMEPFEIEYQKDVIYNNGIIESSFEKCIVFSEMPVQSYPYYYHYPQISHPTLEDIIQDKVLDCMYGIGEHVEAIKDPEAPEFEEEIPWKWIDPMPIIWDPIPIDIWPKNIWEGTYNYSDYTFVVNTSGKFVARR